MLLQRNMIAFTINEKPHYWLSGSYTLSQKSWFWERFHVCWISSQGNLGYKNQSVRKKIKITTKCQNNAMGYRL